MGPLYHWFIGGLMDVHDDFCQRLRKSVVGVLFLPGSLMSFYYSIKLLFIDEAAHGLGKWILGVAAILLTLVWCGQYFLLRHTRRVGDLQAAVIPWATTLLLQPGIWLTPDADRKPLWIIMCLLAVLLQIPKLYLFLGLSFVLTLFADWNTVHLEEPDTMLIHADAYRLSSFDRFIFAIVMSVGIAVTIYNFIQQVAESERRGAALKAANEMTLAILKYQRKYETDAIDDILVEYKVAGIVEADLIAMYETMNDNLKSYRPFLPNYLFQQDTDADGEDEAEEGSEGIISANPSAVLLDTPSQATRTENQPQSNLPPPSANLLNQRGHLFSGNITFALVDINTDRLANAAGDDDFERSSASILKTVAHTVYALAKETKASVHSMLGDTVQLTWNATSSVALAETKGAVFLARLGKTLKNWDQSTTLRKLSRSEATELPGGGGFCLGLNAAICSGKVTVHNITTANQQALIIEAPWLAILEGCFDLAKLVGTAANRITTTTTPPETGCVLMDNRTMKGCQLEVESCPVEQVSHTENGKPFFLGVYSPSASESPATTSREDFIRTTPPAASTMVHQLLGEHVRADNEWMYQLQGDGEGGVTTEVAKKKEAVKQAINYMSENQYVEAVKSLKESRGVAGANPMFVKALEVRCANQLP